MPESIEVPSFSSARVLVCGDLMLDRYWLGETNRISPEAPVPVVSIQQTHSRPGGAANVALNVAALGAKIKLFGVVGEDKEADELNQLLVDAQVTCHFERSSKMNTTTKLRVLGQNQQLLRLDFENTKKAFDTKALVCSYEKSLAGAHVVVLSDYAKGVLENAPHLISLANQHGLFVLVDPKSSDFSHYYGATLLTPNYKEFVAAVGPCQDEAEIVAKAKAQIQQHNLQAILVTRGKEGMLLVEKNGNVLSLSAHAREVYDVTGAGDTVIGVIAASLAAGCDLSQSVVLGNLAAGLVVRKLGAETITESELRHALQKNNDTSAAIVSEAEALHLIQEAKSKKQKVVFTNGCFDVIHAGHIQYLNEAKKLGARLIVAVNTDDSIKRLKGEARPINPLSARMEVLAALRSVDWVVPFGEDTPARLIAQLLPNVLVKGADYQVHEIVGHDVVLKNGGEVKTLKFKDGFSSTQILEKMRGES